MALNKIITRFAPSPTGMLHIGGARTALFNYLYSKNKGGKFMLRIEDTDTKRSTKEAEQEILQSLQWLGIEYEGDIIYQSQQTSRHQEIAKLLVDQGKAYYCYSTKEELDQLREQAQRENKRFKYDRRWRNKDSRDAPKGIDPVIRIKSPIEGKTNFNDQIQGNISVPNEDQDDFIILRSDGTPTYMLAVVVDDYDMGVTNIIRGVDHLTNCAKQIILYDALDWKRPIFAHIPLIYGEDGKKMSKRHGATAVSEYKKMGYLPEAMRNYLLRLGFSHGDDEFISDKQAREWFTLDNVGKSPARFDLKKLNNVNSHYIKKLTNDYLIKYIKDTIKLNSQELDRIKGLLEDIKLRIVTLLDIEQDILFLLDNFDIKNLRTSKAEKIIEENLNFIPDLIEFLKQEDRIDHDNLYENIKKHAESKDIKFKDLASILRVSITGSHISPSIFKIIEICGKNFILDRMEAFNYEWQERMKNTNQ